METFLKTKADKKRAKRIFKFLRSTPNYTWDIDEDKNEKKKNEGLKTNN